MAESPAGYGLLQALAGSQGCRRRSRGGCGRPIGPRSCSWRLPGPAGASARRRARRREGRERRGLPACAQRRDDARERVAGLVRLGDDLDVRAAGAASRLRDHDGGDAGLGERLERVGDQRPPGKLDRRLGPAEPGRGAAGKNGAQGRERCGGSGHAASLAVRRYARGSWPTCFQLPMLGPPCWPRSPGRFPPSRCRSTRRLGGCLAVRCRSRPRTCPGGTTRRWTATRSAPPIRPARAPMRRRRFGSPASRAREPQPMRPSAPARHSASRPARWCRTGPTPWCGSRTRPLRTATRSRSASRSSRAATSAAPARTSAPVTRCLTAGTVLGSAELGVLASIGIAEPECARRPTLAIVCDGRRASWPRQSRCAPAESATRTHSPCPRSRGSRGPRS